MAVAGKRFFLLSLGLFFLGIGLLSFNFYGLKVGITSPALGLFKKKPLPNYEKLEIMKEEEKLVYLNRILKLMSDHMINIWPIDNRYHEFNQRLPFHENFILFFASFFKPEYQRYEFVDYRKGLARGIGQCSQYSIILVGLLNDNGIEAKILPLEGHVVTAVKAQGQKWYVVDPLKSIVLPYDISELEENPDLIVKTCQKTHQAQAINELTKYIVKPNQPMVTILEYSGWKTYYFEKFSYIAKWVLPILLMLPLLINTVLPRKS